MINLLHDLIMFCFRFLQSSSSFGFIGMSSSGKNRIAFILKSPLEFLRLRRATFCSCWMKPILCSLALTDAFVYKEWIRERVYCVIIEIQWDDSNSATATRQSKAHHWLFKIWFQLSFCLGNFMCFIVKLLQSWSGPLVNDSAWVRFRLLLFPLGKNIDYCSFVTSRFNCSCTVWLKAHPLSTCRQDNQEPYCPAIFHEFDLLRIRFCVCASCRPWIEGNLVPFSYCHPIR